MSISAHISFNVIGFTCGTILTSTVLRWMVFIGTVQNIDGYITRLKGCKYSANYTDITADTSIKGNISRTLKDVTRSQCSLYCTLNDKCALFNHKLDDSFCELVESRAGQLFSRPGWQLVATDFRDFSNRGPTCRFLRPKCDGGQLKDFCEDSCEAPGYRCLQFVKLPGVKVIASSVNVPHIVTRINDGDKATAFSSAMEERPWIRMDLEDEFEVCLIILMLAGNDINKSQFKVGNDVNPKNNRFCYNAKLLRTDGFYSITCTKGPMIGRYISMTMINKKPARLELREISVWVYPKN